MQKTPLSLDQLVLKEIQNTNGNLSQVARALGLDYGALKSRFGKDEPAVHYSFQVEPANIRTLAPSRLQRYVIAVKNVGTAWPTKYAEIIAVHRKHYDAGSHEMTQSTRAGWTVLYSIPRLVKAPPRKFFSTLEYATWGQ